MSFLDQPGIAASNPEFAAVYKNMQGNILKGHGRDHVTLIFSRFKAKNHDAAKKVIGKLAEEHVTSFYKQLWERERYKRNGIPSDTFGALYITCEGYNYLEDRNIKLKDDAFKAGMKKRASQLNDPSPELFADEKDTIHFLLLLADDNEDTMAIVSKKIIKSLKKIANIIHIEYGDAIRNANGDGLEHNGYVDGISQPLFLKDEIDAYLKQHNTTAGEAKFNPTAQPGLVLLPDPYVENAKGHYGSYFVFRKLEQNVRDFKKRESDIGEDIYGDVDEFKERVGASLVGRFEDGTPKVVQNEDKLIGSGVFNNFDYKHNTKSGGCPHFAHIKKTNPRTGGKFDDHAMARRGITYGHRNVSTEIDDPEFEQFPKGGVGLLFMSFQKSIKNQFEHIQGLANEPKDGEVDPIIGQGQRSPYKFPEDEKVKHKDKLTHEFKQQTFFKGGEYFFAPSMTYLLNLNSEK